MVSDIVTGVLRSFNRTVLAVVLLYSLLLFIWVKGAPKLLAGIIRACERCPGKSSPFCIVLSFYDEEVLYDILAGFILYLYFLMLYEEERIKYR